MERRRLAGIGFAVRFHHNKQETQKNSQKGESISWIETCVSCFKKSFSKKENWGDSSTKRYENLL